MNEIEMVYRMFVNLAIQRVTDKAMKLQMSEEEIINELTEDMYIMANDLPPGEDEMFVAIMQDELNSFMAELLDREEEYKTIGKIMEEIGWT